MNIAFDSNTEEILAFLESSNEEQLDLLPFGAIVMDPAGTVLHYNQYESNLSGIPRSETMGKNFFEHIAPCTKNPMIAEKFLKSSERLDETFRFIFTYRIKPTRVKLRLLTHPEIHRSYLLVSLISKS